MTERAFMIRAGNDNELVEEFESRSLVAVGWEALGDGPVRLPGVLRTWVSHLPAVRRRNENGRAPLQTTLRKSRCEESTLPPE